jgi:FtsX-like permease family protein
MLAAAVVLITAATTLLGVASLLLGVTQDRGFSEEVERSQPQDVDVTAYLVGLTGADLEDTRQQAQDLVRGVLSPMDPSLTTSVTSRMRELADADQLGYLATSDGFDRRADLVSGRWPADGTSGPPEAVVPVAAATRLGLAAGDQVTLGGEIGLGGVDEPVTVVVVGTFRPRAHAGWDSDPLSGAGFEPAYSDGSVTAPAYGPFVIGDAALLATGSNVSGVRVTGHPDLARADDASLGAAVASLDEASALLKARVGDRVDITRVASDLPRTLSRLHAQRDTTRSTVLVVLLIGTILSLAALLLAGRLVAGVRDDERALLVALGLSRRQQLIAALAESALLAAVSAALAVPIAAFGHSLLTRLPAMRAAGLRQDPTVTWSLVLSVVAGAALLTLALVLPALDTRTTGTPSRRRASARTGVDVLLLVVAAAAWWQLHSQPTTAETSGDLTLTLAPVLFLVATTVVAVRVVPLLLAQVARVGARSTSLVLPLAANQAARRPHTGTAMVLLATAVAAAVFGITLHSTWERSQGDQAALRVGTDASLLLPAPATADEAAAVLSATSDRPGSSVVSEVAERPLVLGSYVGDKGSPPVLVAIDADQAGALLRGRLDGTTWAAVGAGLSPGSPVTGVEVADGSAIELTGRAPEGVGLLATPTAVVQDPAGFRSAVGADPVRLDGRPHRVHWQTTIGPGQLVALRLQVEAAPGEAPDGDVGRQKVVPVSVTLHVPGAGEAAAEPAWEAEPRGGDGSPVRGVSVVVASTGSGVELSTTTRVDLSYLAYFDADILETAFEDPPDVPVAVSQQLADAVGTKIGGEISATVGGTVLPLRVTAIVPTVPSAPGRIAVLADVDTLSRALIHDGRLDPVVDGWWVAHPTGQTVSALRALQLGEVTTRAEVATQLAEGPMRVTVPAALVLLVAAGGLLLLTGAGLLVSADQRRRSAEVARLRALGLTSRQARRLLFAEHVAFLVPLVLVGAAVGVGSAAALGPSLIRSDVGAAPVPDAVVAWLWASEAALVVGLLLGCVVIAAVVAAIHVRRAETGQLRVGDQ